MTQPSTCIHIEAKTEAEKKRVKYLLKKRGISIPEGLIFFVEEEEDDLQTLLNLIMAKTSPQRVHIYKMEGEDFEHDDTTKRLTRTVQSDRESVERMARFLISKRRGEPMPSVMAGVNRYKIYTKKGNTEVLTKIRELDNQQYELTITIHGFKDAVNVIYKEFKKELDIFFQND